MAAADRMNEDSKSCRGQRPFSVGFWVQVSNRKKKRYGQILQMNHSNGKGYLIWWFRSSHWPQRNRLFSVEGLVRWEGSVNGEEGKECVLEELVMWENGWSSGCWGQVRVSRIREPLNLFVARGANREGDKNWQIIGELNTKIKWVGPGVSRGGGGDGGDIFTYKQGWYLWLPSSS